MLSWLVCVSFVLSGTTKASVEALDRAMRDFCNINCQMGGFAILFSGNFRQRLPVMTRGTRADEVNASLKRSLSLAACNKM